LVAKGEMHKAGQATGAPGVSKTSKSANPNYKDHNRLAVNVLRLYFSAPPSGDIHIACQSDRKKSSPQSYSSIVEFSTAQSIHHYYKLTLVNGYKVNVKLLFSDL